MRKRILAYISYMDSLLDELEKGATEERLRKVREEHLTQLAFFQHERLIHLIVTVLFALIEFISLFMFLCLGSVGTLLLTGAVMLLLVPYIRHYYLLENEVQRMYVQYDRLRKMMDACDGSDIASFSVK